MENQTEKQKLKGDDDVRPAFDTKVHIRSAKSGQIVSENHYKLVVSETTTGNGKEWLYERPPGSGLWYYQNDQLHKEKSAAGLKRIEDEKRFASRTAVEKAEAEFAAAQKKLDAAKVAQKADVALQSKVKTHSPTEEN